MGRRRLSLNTLVTGAMVVLVMSTAAAVGWSGFVGARTSVDALWHELADRIAQLTTAEALRMLEPAEPLAHLGSELVATGVLDSARPRPFLDYLTECADAWPGFTWLYYGNESDGSFLGVVREAPGAPLERHERIQLANGSTFQRSEQPGPSGWEVVDERIEPFDPRERPWYRAAEQQAPGVGVWTDPYVFYGTGEPGVTYARAVYSADQAELRGVFAVDLEMAPLSMFLSELPVGQHGRAFVVTVGGTVVGEPHGRLLQHGTADRAFWHALDHPDPLLSAGFRAMSAQADPWATFEFRVPPVAGVHDGAMLGIARPFPADTDIPWLVLTVVPRDDLLGHAEAEAERAVLFALLALVGAVIGGALVSWMIGSNVAHLRTEILRVARFELFDDTDLRSSIRELDEMARATTVMKTALRAFARYVPYQLVQQVLASGREAVLGAERQELTVLFSDIEGFTSVVEAVPTDQVLSALGRYLQDLTAAINERHGVVGQYLGDGIMAFWGAPESMSEHAVNACLGALAMQRESMRLAEEAVADGTPVFKTRIGIDTGEVMVGNIGAPERFSYGILGDTVNTASRFEGMNKQFGTAITAGARTVALARHMILFRPLDRVLPRGKRTPSLLYEVVGPHDMIGDDVLSAVAAYTSALEVYLAGRFEEARTGFLAVLEEMPDDVAAQLMVQRCTALLANPPGKHWSGIFDMPEGVEP